MEPIPAPTQADGFSLYQRTKYAREMAILAADPRTADGANRPVWLVLAVLAHAHIAAIETLADCDAETLALDRPTATVAFEVCRDRSDDEPPSDAEIAIDALGERNAVRVYNARWDVIESEANAL